MIHHLAPVGIGHLGDFGVVTWPIFDNCPSVMLTKYRLPTRSIPDGEPDYFYTDIVLVDPALVLFGVGIAVSCGAAAITASAAIFASV
jgi:hypothetical protein